MTQVWPGLGVAPVPTLLSAICSPDAVVMVFAACAIDEVDVATATLPVNAATTTMAARVRARGRTCIIIPFSKPVGDGVVHVSAYSAILLGAGTSMPSALSPSM